MTDRDLLQRAVKALRETYPAEHDASKFTRGRILRALHEQRRKKLTRWLVLSPLAAILLGGTAWAQATGQWPVIIESAKELLSFGEAPPISVPAAPTPGRKPAARAVTKPEPPDSESPPVADNEDAAEDPAEHEPEATPAEDVALAPLDPPEPKLSRPAKLPAPELPFGSAPSVEPGSNSPAADPELALFREAHDLHFKQGNPSAAISAYARYLDRYPKGRFVPEARYNTALNLLKTGQTERAHALLEPFARGDHGGYRQQEAAALLDANR